MLGEEEKELQLMKITKLEEKIKTENNSKSSLVKRINKLGNLKE